MNPFHSVRLAEVATVRSGFAFKSADWKTSGVPVIKIRNITPGDVTLENCGFVNEELAVEAASYETQLGDPLISMSGATVGEIGRIRFNDRALVNQRVGIFRVKSPTQLNRDFLYHFLQLPDTIDYFVSSAYGSAQPNISPSLILNVAIPLPSVHEQQAIAEVLGALDDKIAANTKLAATAAQLTHSLFTQAVRESSDEFVLHEITNLLSRGVTPKYSEDDGTMMILNQKCVRGQRVELGPARRTELTKVRSDKVLVANDVLVNSTGQGTLGRVARWISPEQATVDSHITIVRFDASKVHPVTAGIGLLGLQDTIIEMGEGSTGQTELSRVELGKLKVRLPNRDQQTELGHRFDDLSKMEQAHLAENKTLAATRDALLPQLMSGKLRVKDAEALVSASA